jgi:hypothetical protein
MGWTYALRWALAINWRGDGRATVCGGCFLGSDLCAVFGQTLLQLLGRLHLDFLCGSLAA